MGRNRKKPVRHRLEKRQKRSRQKKKSGLFDKVTMVILVVAEIPLSKDTILPVQLLTLHSAEAATRQLLNQSTRKNSMVERVFR